MIHTLTTDCTLYKVNRNRAELLLAMEKRKAFWLIVSITVALTIATYFFLIYK